MAEKGKFTQEQIAGFMKRGYVKPQCPFCHDSMIRTHIEHSDGSGWMHCWACDCEGSDPPIGEAE